MSAPSAAGTAPLSWFPLADLPRADVSREYIGRAARTVRTHMRMLRTTMVCVWSYIPERYVYMYMYM